MDERKGKTQSERESAPATKADPVPPAATKSEPQAAGQIQPKVGVAEREPLSIVVIDTPAAEPAIQPETQVEVPVRVPVRTDRTIEEPLEAPRFPFRYWLLAAAALGLLLLSYKNIYSPLLVHIEDSVERHVLGEPSKIWQAPESNPHTRQQKEHWLGKFKW